MSPKTPHRVPLMVKVLFSAFMAVLVPYYLKEYGPTNFLYFCDVALFFTLGALWLESPLLASIPAVGILLPQAVWCADFLGSLVGFPITGMTAYMFNSGISLFARGLSFFHFWLPFFLLYLIWQLGYDRRAFWIWVILAWVLQVVCFFLMPAPPAPSDNPNLPVNINYVYGVSDYYAQIWMPPLAFLFVVMIGMPLIFFWPTHWLLSRFMPAAKQGTKLNR